MRYLWMCPLLLATGCAFLGRGSKDKNLVIDPFVKRGLLSLKKGNFLQAAFDFDKAKEKNPENQEVLRVIERLEKVTPHIARAMGGEDYQKRVRKGIIAYVEGSKLKTSIRALRYAYNLRPQNVKVLKVLNRIEQEAHVETTRPVIDARSRML